MNMEIIPAIDLIEGRCVRLRQGAYQESTVYDGDPLDVARSFEEAGAQRIHLVDLDAARGSGNNLATIDRIRRGLSCCLEVGGGVRDQDALERLLDLGIDYAIVGTILARNPDLVARWAAGDHRGARMLASIDAREGRVQVSGWQESSGVLATELARIAGEIGLAAVEYTNIARDGMLTGPDVAGTVEVARATSLPVILSGGIASTEDTATILREGPELQGFIVGRALYEGGFSLKEALEIIAARGGQ
ncbi:hypothetical protein AU468_11525 [Alkalispirochaeta sphaeroplastigenens]|uniref:1-(5-phosphoribosyl)-5-[(5-phosphoribosylamino)methylideneamino] imidazole-4-carboxamide isomerase n=1 Tax=Alkalispirochaeta sphaeroplastigenens TaxID=1187066 RepID=A0A2S4JHR4_9SPIO|nr:MULTISPECIES: 1-(5-phosphoribosyl)-5-[(5-phosphoribosylamino)methylideneamino] imidazole-4-carboxamide isomerase [Alkalispirochaeta]POQ99009.1 hypothetical protein AU468_11525 [Alkalispirochaeta sphaeroplastigenens]